MNGVYAGAFPTLDSQGWRAPGPLLRIEERALPKGQAPIFWEHLARKVGGAADKDYLHSRFFLRSQPCLCMLVDNCVCRVGLHQLILLSMSVAIIGQFNLHCLMKMFTETYQLLGGGLSGVAAAKACVEAGLRPHIFEQSTVLGGSIKQVNGAI